MARPAKGYFLADGTKVPGTTTVIGRFKESGGLLRWAHAQGLAGKPLYEERDKAGAAGNIAHDMIESDILGKRFVLIEGAANPDLLIKAENAYKQFLEWRANSRMDIIATEQSYVSERHRFGGTVDAVGQDAKGRIVLLDWKTSNAVYSDYLIQLAAYALLLEECTNWRPEGFHLLRVSKESADFAHHYFGELDDAKELFLLFRRGYELDANLRKRAA